MKYDVYFVVGQPASGPYEFRHRGHRKYPRRFSTLAHVRSHLKNRPLQPGEGVYQFASLAEGPVTV